jgi:hypothetical protein
MMENFGAGNLNELLSENGGKFNNPLKGKTLALSPGKPVTVRIMGFNNSEESNFFHFKSHYVNDPALPSSWKSKMKYVTCTGAGCPLCAAGHKATDRYGFLVIHLDNFEENEMGQLVRHPKKKILTTGITLAKMLGIKHKQVKPLSSSNLQLVTISGGGGKTTYSADFVEGAVPQPFDENGLTNNFEILKPTQRDFEEATRLAGFIKAGTPQTNTLGNNYAPPVSTANQGFTQVNRPVDPPAGSWAEPSVPSGSWVEPSTVAGNPFFQGGNVEESYESVPF